METTAQSLLYAIVNLLRANKKQAFGTFLFTP